MWVATESSQVDNDGKVLPWMERLFGWTVLIGDAVGVEPWRQQQQKHQHQGLWLFQA